MKARWMAGMLAAGLGMSSSAQAAVPVPRAGCFAVHDAVGDGSVLTTVDPAFGPASDPAVDITGLNLGVTPKTVTVYLSLAKLADPFTAATLPASYDVHLQSAGSKPMDMWLENFGPAQPARDLVKDVAVPDPSDPPYHLRYARSSHGAWVNGSGAEPGTPISVTVTKDLAHSLIAWTFDRATLQRASGMRFDRGRLVTLGPSSTLYNVADLTGAPADESDSGLVRIGSTHCV